MLRGWALHRRARPIQIVEERDGLITLHDISFEREDVIEYVSSKGIHSYRDSRVGFHVETKVPKSGEIRVGILCEGVLHWWIAVSLRPVDVSASPMDVDEAA